MNDPGRRAPWPVPRPFAELRESGLLWLINSVVFHPRGFALGLRISGGEVVGWVLLGDGSEPWRFDGDVDRYFAAAEATLAANRESTAIVSPGLIVVAARTLERYGEDLLRAMNGGTGEVVTHDAGEVPDVE